MPKPVELNSKSLNELSEEELKNLDMESLLDLDKSPEWISNQGEIVTGTVVQVDSEFIYLNYGQKSEGRVPRSEVAREIKIQDKFNALIMAPEGNEGFSYLSITQANKKIAWDRLTTEEESTNLIVEGKIKKIVNGGYLADVSGLSFFLPGSQLGGIKFKDISEVEEKNYDFKVIKLDHKKKSGVLSRRQLLDDLKQKQWKNFLENNKAGDRAKGVVKGITDYGAFVEFDGLKGLLHVSDMTWKKNVKVEDIVKKNEIIEVIILKIDEENHRISFGMKQLGEDPWLGFVKDHNIDDILTGKVTQVTSFGAFVAVTEAVEGLVHITELSWSRRIQHPKQIVKKGDEVEAVIIKIDKEERRLSLSLKNIKENPWEKIAQKVSTNEILKRKVTKVSEFGAFVQIDTDVEGLIHSNDLSWEDNRPKNTIKEGEEIEFKVLEIIPKERKITCSIKHLTKSPWELLKEKYLPGTKVTGKITGIVAFGVFVEIEENVEGLVHISHLAKQKIETISGHFKKGDLVKAVVLGVDIVKKRISLSLKEYDRQTEKETILKYMKDPKRPQKMTLGDLVNLNGSK